MRTAAEKRGRLTRAMRRPGAATALRERKAVVGPYAADARDDRFVDAASSVYFAADFVNATLVILV